MLTPKFFLSQDAEFVYIHICVPHIKLPETECYVSEDEFYFYSQPYYLRLHLPGRVLDNEFEERSTSHFDSDTGRLTIRLSKETKGVEFHGLDMLTKLLTPKSINQKSEIEVISSRNENQSSGGGHNGSGSLELNASEESDLEGKEESECDWFIEQKVNEASATLVLDAPKYGFANKRSKVLSALTTEVPGIIDLTDADNAPVCQRKLLRNCQERQQFNCEHYLADLFEDDEIQELISLDYCCLTGTIGDQTILSDKENEKLMQLPRRKYILDEFELQSVYLGLVDLMFAYAYDFRFRKGESNVESDWTICKLSATLSWLDSFENIKDVVISCARRSLIFPLYRNWFFFQRVLSDVRVIFNVGKSQILKCLLAIHSTLSQSEVRYPLNDLYITDYCIWIQSSDPKRIESMAKVLAELKISKSDVDLDLDEMEAEARKLISEQSSDEDTGNVMDKLACSISNVVKITENEDSDSDDDDSNDTDDSSSSSYSEECVDDNLL